MFKLPNLITLINLFSGCLAVVFLFRHNIVAVLVCIGCSLLADFLDGLVARALQSYSDMGKELDSLADMVSFGFLPGAMMFYMMQAGELDQLSYISLSGFVITLFAALRLAKFNIDTRQSDGFMGMPTPSATLFISGLLLLFMRREAMYLFEFPILICISIALAQLMISDLPMFSLKFKGLSWKGNEIRYIFIIFAVLIFALARDFALSLIIAIYTVYSLIAHFIKKK